MCGGLRADAGAEVWLVDLGLDSWLCLARDLKKFMHERLRFVVETVDEELALWRLKDRVGCEDAR